MSSGSPTCIAFVSGITLFTALGGATASLADTTVAGPGFDARSVPIIAADELSIAYQLAGDSPITRVDLWYTADEGATWRESKSPVVRAGAGRHGAAGEGRVPFRPEKDGLYGFFLVLHNEAGASSPPPEPGMAPQQWIRVDRAPPSVNILSVRKDDRFDVTREVAIRWEVLDSNLPDRPVALHYRTVDTKSYRLIADAQAARSAYRWTAPPDVDGRVEFKVSAIDLAGHRSHSIADALEIHSETEKAGEGWLPAGSKARSRDGTGELSTESSLVAGNEDSAAERRYSEPDAGVKLIDDKATARARQRYDLGTWHRLRGEYDLARERYREALDESPMYHAARHDLAALLLLLNEVDEARLELTRLLKEDPEYRAALRTMALLHTRQKNFRSAAECLDRLLLLEPADAEAWLYRGDVSLFRGDRPAAREAWEKIGALPAVSEALKSRARTRLEMYSAEGNKAP